MTFVLACTLLVINNMKKIYLNINCSNHNHAIWHYDGAAFYLKETDSDPRYVIGRDGNLDQSHT